MKRSVITHGSSDNFEGLSSDFPVIGKLMWRDTSMGQVFWQMYGSVWPRVFWFCLGNTLWAGLIWLFKHFHVVDLTVGLSGHRYVAIVVAFLLVTRLQTMFGRYMENSRSLTMLFKAGSDLMANVCVLTERETGERAKQWRQDVAYSLLILLRVSIAALLFPSDSHENPWTLPEFLAEYQEDKYKYCFDDAATLGVKGGKKLNEQSSKTKGEDEDDDDVVTASMPEVSKAVLAHIPDSERNPNEEVLRASLLMALDLRQHLMKQRDGSWFEKPHDQVFDHPCNEELRWLDLVGDILKANAQLYKLLLTPMPYPFIQMTKTFLYIWLYTLPLALLHERYTKDDNPIVPMFIVFILTYGFLGVEFVSVELTDNFGDDPSDFDALGLMQICFEDCYWAIYQLDGDAWAQALRKRVALGGPEK